MSGAAASAPPSLPRTPASSAVSSAARAHAPVDRTLAAPKLPPSAFGYATEKPVHREARRMLHDRDKREKTRVADGAIPTTTNPLVSQPISAGFAVNAERLRRDIPAQLSTLEAQRKEHKLATIKSLGASREAMERERWERMEAAAAKAEREARAVAGTGLRNKGSVGYNLINGSFGTSEAAAKAKFHDDRVEYTAKLRMKTLDQRANTDFNVITGAPRFRVVVPPAPTPPSATPFV